MIKKALVYLLSTIYLIVYVLFGPLVIQLKVWYNNLKAGKRKYKYRHFCGSITLTNFQTKEEAEEIFAIVEIPDKNIWTDYWRRFHNLSRFRYKLSFDEYVKFDLIKASNEYADIECYKLKQLSNFKYVTNYDSSRNQ